MIQDIQDTEYGIPLGTGYAGYRIYRIQNMGYPWVKDMQDTGYTGYRIWDTPSL